MTDYQEIALDANGQVVHAGVRRGVTEYTHHTAQESQDAWAMWAPAWDAAHGNTPRRVNTVVVMIARPIDWPVGSGCTYPVHATTPRPQVYA